MENLGSLSYDKTGFPVFLLSHKVKAPFYQGFIHHTWQTYLTHFSENLMSLCYETKGFPVILLSHKVKAEFYRGFLRFTWQTYPTHFSENLKFISYETKKFPDFIVSQSVGPILPGNCPITMTNLSNSFYGEPEVPLL